MTNYYAVSEFQPGVAQITITNSGKANVLSSEIIEALIAEIKSLGERDDLRALVLASSGDRTFIGGADINEMAGLNRVTGEAFITRLRDLCTTLRNLRLPVVARIQGWCLGGGLEVAMACDMRVATTQAKFSMPEVKVGIPSVIHAALMPRLIGSARARWLILTGATIDAAKAWDWGLVDVVTSPDSLDAAITEALAPILECGPAVIAQQKELMNSWDELPLSAAVDQSIKAFGKAFDTGEPQKYMQHFIDRKR
ncbi:enoyl-CoA hydratase [Tardiphaga sp. 803_E3_N1_3]|uniref:enoyl-CoA hydratase n=1 Tax=Tardiphaga sp. 803_E3_N1_3 TaxID=3240785 RepID=UPI003F2782CE